MNAAESSVTSPSVCVKLLDACALALAANVLFAASVAAAPPSPATPSTCDFVYARMYELETVLPRDSSNARAFRPAGHSASGAPLYRYEDRDRIAEYVRTGDVLQLVEATLKPDVFSDQDREKKALLERLGLSSRQEAVVSTGCDAIDIDFRFSAERLQSVHMKVHFN